MTALDLTTVSTTRETKEINGWIYRIIESDRGTTVHRVPADERFWGHGIIKQIYQPTEGVFVPACQSGLGVYTTLDRALEAVLSTGE